jgi:hypothetical protein
MRCSFWPSSLELTAVMETWFMCTLSWNSWVSYVTAYAMDCWGLIPGKGRMFYFTISGAHPLSYQMCTPSSSAVGKVFGAWSLLPHIDEAECTELCQHSLYTPSWRGANFLNHFFPMFPSLLVALHYLQYFSIEWNTRLKQVNRQKSLLYYFTVIYPRRGRWLSSLWERWSLCCLATADLTVYVAWEHYVICVSFVCRHITIRLGSDICKGANAVMLRGDYRKFRGPPSGNIFSNTSCVCLGQQIITIFNAFIILAFWTQKHKEFNSEVINILLL